MSDLHHVVMFSGGVGSWAAAKRVAAQHGTQRLTLLFVDTLMEDEDLYRFLVEGAANVLGSPLRDSLAAVRESISAQIRDHGSAEVKLFTMAWPAGGSLVWRAEGRTPWQVFRDEKILSQRFDPCSKLLKRQQADRYVQTYYTPENCVRYVGIDWSESHRLDRLRERMAPWRVEAPLCDAPYLTKAQMLDSLKAEGIAPPRLYSMGFSHNNCGGFCIKAGHGHFVTLLRAMPERYAYHEEQERMLRASLGPDAAVLRDRSGGVTRPMTLQELRERVESGASPDLFDIGGCGCFTEAA